MTRSKILMAFASAVFFAVGCTNMPAKEVATKKPNVLIIIADDLGFSDLGAFGGEIDTPNLNALAMSGVRLTDFHAAPACSPTRSMLLSGTDNHTAGVGVMSETPFDHTGWGNEGYLTTRVATLAERLKEHGYATIMTGKWHLGLTPDTDPYARGFDYTFALRQGAHNHFGKGGFGSDDDSPTGATYTDDGKSAPIPADFYSSDYFAAKFIDKLKAVPKDKPFFGYLAFTAPHSPLQAPKDLIAKYKGRYDAGWDVLRVERLEKMKALGVIPRDIVAHPMVPDTDSWNKLSTAQKVIEARKMEIYAAMVDDLDQNVGKLIAHLKQTGQFENTIILFTSDNGPAAETGKTFESLAGVTDKLARTDNSLENMGSATSMVFYGRYWAQAASAPYRLHKAAGAEGGTRVAAFVTYPAFQRHGGFGRAFADVMDVVPTILEAANIAPNNVVNSRQVAPIRGRSMLTYLKGGREIVHAPDEAISFELHGHRAVRQGDWKLLRMPPPFSDDQWALYNLASDPAEQNDVSAQFPDKKKELLAAWFVFAKETQIKDSAPKAAIP